MARIRSVKPELRTSLTATRWPREVRLFWVLLWGYLDDHGYGVDEPRLIKPDCFPLDDDLTPDDIDKWLDLIASAGSICRFTVNGRYYLHAPKWADHQRPQHPAVPKYPVCTLPHDDLMTPSGESHETFGGANGTQPEHAGQTISRESHETLCKPRESLTPEGVVEGVVEQGDGAVARATRTRKAATLLANSLLDEHRRLVKPSLPRDVARQIGEKIDSLLDDQDIDPDEIREGLRRLRSNRKWGPGMLPNLVHEVRQERAGEGTPRASPSLPGSAADQRRAEVAQLREIDRRQREGHPPGTIQGSVIE